MDVVGLGTHVVDCPRVARLLHRHADVFLAQVYTANEQAFCRGRTHTTEHYAAVWAAKEAVYKSLGTAWRKGLLWTDVEVADAAGPAARATLAGAAAELARARGVRAVLVTLAHTRAFATATAVAVG